MKKAVTIILVAAMALLLLSGCSGLVTKLSDKLEEFTADGLVIRVTQVKDGGIKGQVVNGDSHFDLDDNVYLYYDRIVGTNKVSVRDEITVSYDYTANVSAEGKIPVIRVEVVSLHTPEK